MNIFDAGTPLITEDVINEIQRIETEHLGGGVVRFKNTCTVDPKLLSWVDENSSEAFEQNWTYDTDEDGNVYALNSDKNKFTMEQVKTVPTRLLQPVDHNTPTWVVDTFHNYESVIYQCLIRYVDMFPLILGTLWWRSRGHVLHYAPGSFLGVHNDNDSNYRVLQGERYVPSGQGGSRQVIAIILYLNDGVSKPEDLDGTNYTGGEITFPYLDIEYQGKTGDVLIFPANYMGSHGVNTVLEGTRYSYLEFMSHGSPAPEVLVEVFEPEEVKAWCEPHWLMSIYEDYEKYALHVQRNSSDRSITDAPNPVFQNRSLEGEVGLKKAYYHEDVITKNLERGHLSRD